MWRELPRIGAILIAALVALMTVEHDAISMRISKQIASAIELALVGGLLYLHLRRQRPSE